MQNKKIFVIIVTYKGGRWYDRCFGSLRESEIPLHVIAVDNSPGEEDAEYIRTHFPEVHIIKTNENLGFGKANNLGMRYALDNDCDYVFLLNQDAWIEPNSISQLVTIAEKYPEYGIISPMHMTADMQHLNFIIDDGNHNYELLSDVYTHNLKEIYTTKYVNAAAWLLPRQILENIGGFCPLIYHYGEDDDYMRRVLYHGYKIGLVPSSRIVHDTSQRLANSEELSLKACNEDLDSFLDITNPQSVRKHKCRILKKRIIAAFMGNKKNHKYYANRFQVLVKNQKEIERCREQHKKKQSSWL